ncbi:hypothetical protein K456DRAFT_33323 [Colletotrichum gloeosporioides 23]|nr:hypothetical protein K456DRAFT_33323 [Colletotrichum gloeosporioides 23]
MDMAWVVSWRAALDVPSAKWGSSGTHRSTSDNMRRVARRSTAYHLPSQRYARQNPISRRPPTEESTQAKEHSAGPHEVSNSTMVSLSRPARLCQQQHGQSESEGVGNTSRRTCHRRPRFTPDSTRECCCSFQSAPLPENAPSAPTTQLGTFAAGIRLVGASGVLQSRPRQETAVSHLRIALHSSMQVDRRRPYEYNRGTVKSARTLPQQTANGRGNGKGRREKARDWREVCNDVTVETARATFGWQIR